MYTSKERVIRDGRLIAFAGEIMSDAEALRRGLNGLDDEDTRTNSDLKAELDSLGIKYPKNANKSKLLELLNGGLSEEDHANENSTANDEFYDDEDDEE